MEFSQEEIEDQINRWNCFKNLSDLLADFKALGKKPYIALDYVLLQTPAQATGLSVAEVSYVVNYRGKGNAYELFWDKYWGAIEKQVENYGKVICANARGAALCLRFDERHSYSSEIPVPAGVLVLYDIRFFADKNGDLSARLKPIGSTISESLNTEETALLEKFANGANIRLTKKNGLL